MYNYNSRNSQIDTSSASFYLIAINIIFFLVSMGMPGLFPHSAPNLFLGMHYPTSEFFRPWQIITNMFMHADIVHISFNMLNLYMFGTILERVWGKKRFLEFYFLTGLGATLLHTAVQALQIYNFSGSFAPSFIDVNTNGNLYGIINSSSIGASGSVFGLLIAFAMLFPNTELMLMFIPVPIKAKYLIAGFIVMELYLGLANNPNDNIAHFAHLGGALIGFIVVKIWNRNRNFLY